jgi:hypothetical protein
LAKIFKSLIILKLMARPRGFEPLTFASGGQRSIQLSYGRVGPGILHALSPRQSGFR